MKKLYSILSVSLLALVIGFASCTKQSPAIEFCNQIDKFVKEMNEAKDPQQLEALSASKYQEQAIKICEQNADYVLTEADKEALKKSLNNLLKTSMTKQYEILGQPVDETAIESFAKSIDPTIEKATTLGEFGNKN